MPYESDKDQVVWAGLKRDYKPKATIQPQIKSYNNGEPKLTLVEEGIGYNGKTYTGFILKRANLDDVKSILEMIDEALPELKRRHNDWFQRQEAERKKSRREPQNYD